MSRRLRRQVAKGQHLFVLVKSRRRNRAGGNFAKEAIRTLRRAHGTQHTRPHPCPTGITLVLVHSPINLRCSSADLRCSSADLPCPSADLPCSSAGSALFLGGIRFAPQRICFIPQRDLLCSSADLLCPSTNLLCSSAEKWASAHCSIANNGRGFSPGPSLVAHDNPRAKAHIPPKS